MTWGPDQHGVDPWDALEKSARRLGYGYQLAAWEAEHYKAAYHRAQKRTLLFSTVALLWAFVRLWWVMF